MRKLINKSGTAQTNRLSSLAAMIAEPEDFFYIIGNPTDFLLYKTAPLWMRPDTYGI